MKAKKKPAPGGRAPVVQRASIERRIYFVRNQKVMVDNDLPISIAYLPEHLIKQFAVTCCASRRILCFSSLPTKPKT
jgi:hypothetical protein